VEGVIGVNESLRGTNKRMTRRACHFERSEKSRTRDKEISRRHVKRSTARQRLSLRSGRLLEMTAIPIRSSQFKIQDSPATPNFELRI
jgi:hypothetical protein